MNHKIDKILACVDFSDHSLLALAYAFELAQGSNITVMVYNVINQRDIDLVKTVSKYAPDKLVVEDYIRDVKKERQLMLTNMIKANFPDAEKRMAIKIDTGIPFEAILKTIESDDIDLVVMANKGRGDLSRVLFGSVAEKVFRHSPVPVVSVRDRSRFKRSNNI